MGACLEYAARADTPLMMYVFSDGSLSASGRSTTRSMAAARASGPSDNQYTASPFFLVYNPHGRAIAAVSTGPGWRPRSTSRSAISALTATVMRSATPGANTVNLLVETVVLNYMALHGEQGQFGTKFPGNGLGNSTSLDRLTALAPICNGLITNPV